MRRSMHKLSSYLSVLEFWRGTKGKDFDILSKSERKKMGGNLLFYMNVYFLMIKSKPQKKNYFRRTQNVLERVLEVFR